MAIYTPTPIDWEAEQKEMQAHRQSAGEQVSDAEVRAAAQYIARFDISTPAALNVEAYHRVCGAYSVLYRSGHLASLAPVLPLLLTLKGKPFSLANHFSLESLFTVRPPRKTTVKAGRQVAKSTSNAANICIQSVVQRYFRTLYVAPRFDQTKRFSTDYVRPFINESPIGREVVTSMTVQNALQREFPSRSVAYFSYAFLDCDRIRGISADCVRYDEAQDLDPMFIPVIHEVLSASDYRIEYFTGTPKTLDNLLEFNWEESSQSEWVIPCRHCRHWNIPAVAHDALAMITPKGLTCARCGKLVEAADGHLIHAYPERAHEHLGIHTPQIIFPMHYRPDPKTGSMERWAEIVKAKDGAISTDKFYNEKLGESYDIRAGLVTKSDLQKASTLGWNNHMSSALAHSTGYVRKIMGVDWGGGGEQGISLTSVSIIGGKTDGTVEVLYTVKLANAMSHMEEVKMILHIYTSFRCQMLAHDFGGSGHARETQLTTAGFNSAQLFPCFYDRASVRDMVVYHPPSPGVSRGYFNVDKARSLSLLCSLIKGQAVRFPIWESWQKYADDFLALVEDKHAARGADVYLIDKKASKSDDTVHSVNFAATAFWFTQRRWPDTSGTLGLKLTPAQFEELRPNDHDYGR